MERSCQVEYCAPPHLAARRRAFPRPRMAGGALSALARSARAAGALRWNTRRLPACVEGCLTRTMCRGAGGLALLRMSHKGMTIRGEVELAVLGQVHVVHAVGAMVDPTTSVGDVASAPNGGRVAGAAVGLHRETDMAAGRRAGEDAAESPTGRGLKLLSMRPKWLDGDVVRGDVSHRR